MKAKKIHITFHFSFLRPFTPEESARSERPTPPLQFEDRNQEFEIESAGASKIPRRKKIFDKVERLSRPREYSGLHQRSAKLQGAPRGIQIIGKMIQLWREACADLFILIITLR